VVTPDKIVTLLQGMRAYAAAHPNITITEDYNGADVAVVCVGVDKESEDYDRPSMVLPASPINQNELVGSVASKVKKTIVVYTGGSASTAGKWSDVPAIIVAFYPGREQGTAMAEAIFGEFNPGGHLCVTFPKTISDLPSYDQIDQELTLTSADSAHGYFYFEKTGKKPLFWFGHGLSYTTFKFESIRTVGAASISSGDRIDVIVSLTNTGDISGDQVVQLYVKPKAGSLPRRIKDLRGFSRVTLAAKQTREVPFTLGPRDFSVYTPDKATKTGKWEVVPGTYDIIAGPSSNPDVLTGQDGLSVITTITVN
jgi:beta-glucosidase